MKLIKRVLLKPHTHKGKLLQPAPEGQPPVIIELRPDQAAWLDSEKVTGPLANEAPVADAPAPAASPAPTRNRTVTADEKSAGKTDGATA
jgi:hypothetical protein